MLRRTIGWGDSGPAASIPPLPSIEALGTRLLIAPHNAAAKGWYWARAARTLPDTAAISMHVDRGDVFLTPGDSVVPEAVWLWSRRWQSQFERFVGSRFTHVIAESGWRVMGNGVSGLAIDEVRWMQRRGIAVALLFHGSDIRDPDRHLATHPASPYAPGLWASTDTMRGIVAANQQLIADAGVPVFVSTPDLLDEVPGAQWLPVVVDLELWASPPPEPTGRPLRVAHAPSSLVLKGTELVEPTLQRLHDEGVIDYVRVTDTPFSEMPEIIRRADVFLDQFRLGIYGVAACEAMAAGRVVVSHVSTGARENVRRLTGLELPIVEATADEVESLLREMAVDLRPWLATAEQGVAFTRVVHNGERSAESLRSFVASQTEHS